MSNCDGCSCTDCGHGESKDCPEARHALWYADEAFVALLAIALLAYAVYKS